MFRRLLLLAGALFVVLAASVAPASAQYAPAPTGGITVTPTAPGGTATVSACCFQPGSNVSFSVGGAVIGSAVADSSGVATGSFDVPAGTTGSLNIAAAGTGADGLPLTRNVVLAIAGAGGASPTVAPAGTLPVTGSNLALPLSVGGAALIGVGALAVMATRRRATADVSV